MSEPIGVRLSQLEERVEAVAQVGQEQVDALLVQVEALEKRVAELEREARYRHEQEDY